MTLAEGMTNAAGAGAFAVGAAGATAVALSRSPPLAVTSVAKAVGRDGLAVAATKVATSLDNGAQAIVLGAFVLGTFIMGGLYLHRPPLQVPPPPPSTPLVACPPPCPPTMENDLERDSPSARCVID